MAEVQDIFNGNSLPVDFSLLSEFHSSQAALEQLSSSADKALPCRAGPDVLIQGSPAPGALILGAAQAGAALKPLLIMKFLP